MTTLQKNHFLLLVFLAALVGFGPYAQAQSLEPINIEIEKATALETVIKALDKIPDSGVSVAERLTVYNLISKELLDLSSRIPIIEASGILPSDAPYAIELAYLTALDVKIKSSGFWGLGRLRLQEVLRDRFLHSLDEWRLLVESGIRPQTLEPREDAMTIEEKIAEEITGRIQNRSIHLARALIDSMDETERASLARRQKQWFQLSEKWLKADLRDLRKARRRLLRTQVKEVAARPFDSNRYRTVNQQLNAATTTFITVVLNGALIHAGGAFMYGAASADALFIAFAGAMLGKTAFANKHADQVNIATAKIRNVSRKIALDSFFNEVTDVSAEAVGQIRCVRSFTGAGTP